MFWTRLLSKIDSFMKSVGNSGIALVISHCLGVTSSTIKGLLKYILDKVWKKTEVILDEKAFEQDQKPITEETLKEDKKVYDQFPVTPPRKAIKDEDRKKLIDQDIDFLNGGRRP